jgi:hypothetical protein
MEFLFYLFIGYFADLTIPVIKSPVVPDYHPAVFVKLFIFSDPFH